jgi:glycosyltransferase involved in cell wall biosynthesis
MRILHLANHCHEIGNGIMNVAVDIACRQAEAGHAVAFASAGGSYVELLSRHGVGHHDLAQNWRTPWTLPRSFVRLRSLLRHWRPEIVHAHMMTGALLGRVARTGQRWRLVTTVHNEWQRSAIAMTVGDRVIAVSAAVAEQMARRGIPRRKIDVVLNGPLGSPRRRSEGPAAPLALSQPAILTVAGLYERKGIGDLIAAFERLAPRHETASLHIVGDGPDRAAFEAQAMASRFRERIHFAGFQRDPGPWYRAADVFALVSRSEPFGLVIAEAREAGCAIVASNVGGIPEVLEGGRAGLLVPPADPARLAEVLSDLLADAATLAHWRAAARRGLEWLDVRRVADDTVEVYRRALGLGEPRRDEAHAPEAAFRNAGQTGARN